MNFYLYWVQVKDLTIASLKSRYRKTWAGFLWVAINPILMFGVQSLVFKTFLRLDVPNYYLFLLGGLLPWIFLSSTVLMATPSLVSQAYLLKSFKINPLVILSSQVLDNFINFLASFFIILCPFYFISGRPITALLLIPVALAPLLLGTLALCIILSVLNVFFRDTNFVIGFIFSLLFFLTPIFYPREYVPQAYQWMIDVNPALYFIDPFRVLIHEQSLENFGMVLMRSLSLAIGLTLVAVLYWKRKQNDFYRKL